MTRKLLTVDEFRAGSKDGARIEGTVVRLATAEPEVAAEDTRTIRFVFSDGTVDRAGDSIDPQGWKTDSFMANPVALWSHDSFSPPIGRASNVGPAGGKLMGDIEFMSAEISAFADSIYRMVKAGFVKAVSVGFIPLEWTFVNDAKRPYGIDFKRQELLEISICPVPCNPNALQEAKSFGIDVAPLREWASRLLDDGSQVLVPRNLLEETFRQAKTPRSVRQKYLAKGESPDWKVGAARDLPIAVEQDWDGPAAAKRLLDAAGLDGDKPDFEMARCGFLIHDAVNPMLRSSYKLPFADVVDGEVRAVPGGINAARERADQADAPDTVLSEAKAALNLYEGLIASDNPGAPPTHKGGRRISRANEDLLRKAMDHHESASKCIKDVLDSNESVDEPEPDNNPGPEVIVSPEDTKAAERAARIAEAKALKDSVK